MVGHSAVFQILLQIAVRMSIMASPPAWTNSAVFNKYYYFTPSQSSTVDLVSVRCFCYFQKTGSSFHNFFVVKNFSKM